MEFVLFCFVTATVILGIYGFVLHRANAKYARETAANKRAVLEITWDLERMRARANALGDVAAEGLIVLNPAREVVYANQAARDIFADANPIGRRFSEIAWSFDLGGLVTNALAGKIEIVQQTVVKDQRAFLARARPIGPNAEYGAVVAIQEVTELQRLGRARRDFVANISHELRTPLASVRLLVETLAKGALNEPNMARDLLAKIDAEVDALNQLSEELLDLAQIESGQSPLKLLPEDLGKLVEKTVARFALQADRKNIALHAVIGEGLNALVDADKFDKVLGNLLHNALKFTLPGGRVAVDARGVEDLLEIRVADTGVGIPARDLPRIFERFYKVDRARSREERGTGLGLAIAKHIVEAHGGRIWVESMEGAGAAFYFTVPRA